MPSARSEGSPALSIALAGSSKRVFQAGDTIIGKVVRRQHIVVPDCQVTIRLLGRAKTKIVETRSTGNGTRHETYRSRYNFFGHHAPETSQVIHSGPLHVAAEQADATEFPFAVTIPTHPSQQLSREADQNSFLPTDVASVATQLLPPSYASYHHHNEGYVEYWLEAQLTPGPGTNNKAVTPVHSTQPILVGAPRTLEPAPRMVKTCTSPPHSITSYKLVPQMDQVELTLKQKSKQFFHTSSVPTLSYSIHMGLPVAMQLQAHESIPLTLRLLPTLPGTSDDVRKITQKATINHITVHLKKYTVIRAGEHFFGGPRERNMSDTDDLDFGRVLSSLPAPMIVDIDPDGERIDLGALFDVRLSELGFCSGNGRLAANWYAPPITPSFTTYNMKVTHALKVTISVTVCGKEHSDTFRFDTRIMPPPAAALQPAPSSTTQVEAGPAPPSFTEAMQWNANDECPPDYRPGPKSEVVTGKV